MSRHVVTVGAIVAGLSIFPSAEAQFSRSEELVCSGSVTYGQSKFSDQVILYVSNREVEVNGQAGKISTFEGMRRYKICSESQNERDFEYTTAEKCGTNSTRSGHLDKVLGNLRLSRSDRGHPFVGDYKCKPLQRVLK
jgi:uncharacterized protein YlbG (UPF0298 family)